MNRRPGMVSLEDLDDEHGAGLSDAGASAALRLEHADLAVKVVAGLDCLTRQERIVFVLRDLQEMPTREIGRVLRLSQITVRRHCLTARKKLRDRVLPRNS